MPHSFAQHSEGRGWVGGGHGETLETELRDMTPRCGSRSQPGSSVTHGLRERDRCASAEAGSRALGEVKVDLGYAGTGHETERGAQESARAHLVLWDGGGQQRAALQSKIRQRASTVQGLQNGTMCWAMWQNTVVRRDRERQSAWPCSSRAWRRTACGTTKRGGRR